MSADRTAVQAGWQWYDGLRKDRAARARLRRCQGPLEALLLRETHDLIKALAATGFRPGLSYGDQRVAVLALALARISMAGPTPLAKALGQLSEGGQSPLFSPLRFSTLMRAANARDWDALTRSLRRALAILGDTPIDVNAFIRDLLYLDDETLRRWTYQYWQTTAPPGERADRSEPLPSDPMDATS